MLGLLRDAIAPSHPRPPHSVHSVHAPAGIFLLQTRKASSRRVRVARAASHSLPRTLRALPRQHRPGSLAPESALIPTDSAPPPPTPAGPAVAGPRPRPRESAPSGVGRQGGAHPPPPPPLVSRSVFSAARRSLVAAVRPAPARRLTSALQCPRHSWHRCARGRSGWQTVRILLQNPYCNTTIVLQGFCAPSLKGRRVRRLILRFFIRPYQMGEFRLSFLPARLLSQATHQSTRGCNLGSNSSLAASVVASCTGVCSRARWNMFMSFDTTARTHAGSSK